MKQNIILWIAAAVITFIAGFLQSRLSGDYPVSGSFGIEGKEIGYKLDRVSYGNTDYLFSIKSEIKNLEGTVNWRPAGSVKWKSSELADSGEIISGKIPVQKPATKVEYYATVNYNNKLYNIPQNNKPVTLTFYGNIPSSISFYYWSTLLGLVLLSVRTGLEYFHHPGKIKKLNIFTLIFAVVNVFAFHPLRTTYKLGAVGKTVIPITEMFQVSSILLVITWIIATALIFNTKNYRIWAPVAAVATLFIFELGKF
jgi:hypothetical protein